MWSYYYCDTIVNYKLFLILLSSFILRIVLLIFFSDPLLILLGWDGLGLTSFLLVIFYKNRKRLGSGLLTVLLNRLGDCFFLVWLAIIIILGKSLEDNIPLGSLLLVILSITKSAQFPFSA